MTKRKAALARKVAWNRAIAEGRVARYDSGFRSFATSTEAHEFVADRVADGFAANIVDPALAQQEYLQ